MAIDESGSGVLICYILFTARDSAKAVHADYNTATLDHLLQLFKQGMGTNCHGEEFVIAVGNTDNDPRERTALLNNWSGIFLLLCIFHVWQAWRNGLNRFLCCIPKGEARQAVRRRLGKFLMRLLKDITNYEEAISAYDMEVLYWKSTTGNKAKGAMAFLKYLRSYLCDTAIWKSWSPAGAIEASERSGRPVSEIARTNNHLESFNGRIKGKYYKPYQHSGRLPRIDVWILVTVTKVMPDFFREQQERQALAGHYAALRTLLPSDSVTTKDPEPNVSGSVVFDAGCYSSGHIEEWVQELENDADEDVEADIDESESVAGESQEAVEADNVFDSIYDDKHNQDLPSQHSWNSEAVDICSTSMDYEESSIRPDVIQYRVCDLLFRFQSYLAI
jgi:hypothetical protein